MNTITKCTILANTHIIPALGARKLRDLSADDIDKWLADKAQVLSTRSLREVSSVLKRAAGLDPREWTPRELRHSAGLAAFRR